MKAFVPRSATTFHAAARWQRCEELIRSCLLELGHEVVDQEWHPGLAGEEDRPSLRIYAHSSRRERPDGGLFLKEMHLPGLFTLDSQGWGVEHSRMRRRPDFDAVDSGAAA